MVAGQIWFIALSDFKERVRRFTFLALCALSVLAAFLFVPNLEAEMTSITVDAAYFQQGTNWTWIPMASALCTGMLLPAAGFFYLRNTLSFDRKTGTIDLVYTSPVSRISYLAGKYISDLFLLVFILFVVIVSSFCMMLMHFPDSGFSILHFLSFFASILPGIFLCSAVALLTEAIPVFRSRSGSWMAGVLFFVMYIISVNLMVDNLQGVIARYFDMTGFAWMKDSIDRSVFQVTGNTAHVALGVYRDDAVSNLKLSELFFMPLLFTREKVWEKGCMIIAGIGICMAASIVMPRYEKDKKKKSVAEKRHRKSNGHGMVVTEVIQTFHNCSVLWFVVMLGLWLSLFLADMEMAQGTLWILTMAWSCILYADYGCREKKYSMDTLLPTFYHAYPRQILIRWCVGGILSLFLSMPVILRIALIGNWTGMIAGILFTFFTPALSIFLGQISGSERVFEIVFLVICYWMLNRASLFELSAGCGGLLL